MLEKIVTKFASKVIPTCSVDKSEANFELLIAPIFPTFFPPPFS